MADLSSTEPRSIDCAGGRISYLEAGAGPVVVFLHGVGSAARSWSAQLNALAPRYRVIAWDAPGYGSSAHIPADTPDASDYAERLLQFVDALGLKRFHLVGHSLGSIMAARFAAQHPARIVSLTLCSVANGHSRLPEDERRKLLDGRLNDLAELGPRAMAEKRGPRLVGPEATAEMRARVIETMGAVDPKGYAQAARMLSGAWLIGDIERLPSEMPVQFITGSADVITPLDANRRAAAARPNAVLHIVPDAGHAIYIEKPEAFNAHLVIFMERYDERS